MTNELIFALIKQGVNDQKDLIIQLKKRGCEYTQSTISRKLKQLGIKKIHSQYVFTNQDSNQSKLDIVFVAPNLCVIRTKAGYAAALASVIDEKLVGHYPEFIGTIAGDDTIFVAINLSDKEEFWITEKIKDIL
jgi:transcriptional regulator of arginine metabolism